MAFVFATGKRFLLYRNKIGEGFEIFIIRRLKLRNKYKLRQIKRILSVKY